MRPISIKNFHKIPILMKLLLLIGTPLCLWLFIIGILNDSGLAFVGAIPLTAVLIGLGFFANYGIKITSKRVVLINQDMLKVFSYEDVSYIEIGFTNDSVFGTVKAKNQKAYDFYFSGVDLNKGFQWFHSRFLESDLKITEKFVKKSIAKLSTCEKVKIQNNYGK